MINIVLHLFCPGKHYRQIVFYFKLMKEMLLLLPQPIAEYF